MILNKNVSLKKNINMYIKRESYDVSLYLLLKLSVCSSTSHLGLPTCMDDLNSD